MSNEEMDRSLAKLMHLVKEASPRNRVHALDHLAGLLDKDRLFEAYPDLKADFDATRRRLVERAEKEAA